MRHTITKEQMVEYLRDACVLMAGSSKEKKYLRVMVLDEVKCETTDLDEAIRVYNEL